MNLLTNEEFYIIPDVKEKIERDMENYNEILDNFFPDDIESIPLLAFAYYSIHNYKNLLEKLNYEGNKEEFAVNSYYYLLHQTDIFLAEELSPTISNELARKDLLEVYEIYNQTPLVVG